MKILSMRALIFGASVTVFAAVGFADSTCAGTYTLVSASATDGTPIDATGAFGGNNGCLLDGFDFSNFVIVPNTGYSSTTLTVTFNTLGTSGYWIGVNQGVGQDVHISFTVTPGLPEEVVSLMIPPPVGGVGTGSVSETICTLSGSGFTASCGSLLASL